MNMRVDVAGQDEFALAVNYARVFWRTDCFDVADRINSVAIDYDPRVPNNLGFPRID
jgi:hypothetical protein